MDVGGWGAAAEERAATGGRPRTNRKAPQATVRRRMAGVAGGGEGGGGQSPTSRPGGPFTQRTLHGRWCPCARGPCWSHLSGRPPAVQPSAPGARPILQTASSRQPLLRQLPTPPPPIGEAARSTRVRGTGDPPGAPPRRGRRGDPPRGRAANGVGAGPAAPGGCGGATPTRACAGGGAAAGRPAAAAHDALGGGPRGSGRAPQRGAQPRAA